MSIVSHRVAMLIAALSVAQAVGPVRADPAPTPPPMADDVPLTDYLGLLAQIAPAAGEGARAYLQAFQQRCGRQLTTTGLRQAISDGGGDPVLMAMIRASHLRDSAALDRLGQGIACERWASR